MKTVSLSIEGMSCAHCVKAVRQALESVDGVTVRELQVGFAAVETSADTPPVDALKAAVEDAGYFAEVVER